MIKNKILSLQHKTKQQQNTTNTKFKHESSFYTQPRES